MLKVCEAGQRQHEPAGRHERGTRVLPAQLPSRSTKQPNALPGSPCPCAGGGCRLAGLRRHARRQRAGTRGGTVLACPPPGSGIKHLLHTRAAMGRRHCARHSFPFFFLALQNNMEPRDVGMACAVGQAVLGGLCL